MSQWKLKAKVFLERLFNTFNITCTKTNKHTNVFLKLHLLCPNIAPYRNRHNQWGTIPGLRTGSQGAVLSFTDSGIKPCTCQLHFVFPFSPAADVEKVEDRAPIENTPEPPIITLDEKGESCSILFLSLSFARIHCGSNLPCCLCSF